jgi:hypothetical protein
MNLLTTFILIGMVDSHDSAFATVELNNNPMLNGGPALAVMPVSAFPCEIYEGKIFYVVKLQEEDEATVVCQKEESNGRSTKKDD